jgi:predicted nucleic acid-binding protein
MEKFLAPAKVIYVDEAIEQQTIKVKQNKKIKTPDAIIAATAILYQMTIVSRNVSDFDRIEGIKIYNPFQ